MLPLIMFAASDDIIITQQIGIDTTPPSVPVGVTTTPVATTQINVSWSTSTDDNVGLSGYQVFRDDVQIATTSLTSYSDTGLTPSTTYAYNITAFDTFFNISARSATSSTTTLPLAATTTPTTTVTQSGGGGSKTELSPVELEIRKVQVEVDDTTADIAFNTPVYALSAIRYGTSPQYEIGSLASNYFEKSHRYHIGDLEPNVQYFFEITATNQRGEEVRYTGDFITKALADTVPPANVSVFRAEVIDDAVHLSWENPSEADFDRVRLIANERFYPIDIADGTVLYEGSAESFIHQAALINNAEMYYTIFAIDEEGNRSSGAITMVRAPGVTPTPTPDVPTSPTSPTTTDIVTVPSLTFDDLEFIQNSRIKQGLQSLVDLDPNQAFTIRVPYELVPEHLKTLTITLSDPEDTDLTFAFLLRINDSKTHYEATIAPLKREGAFPLRFSLIDFKTQEIHNFAGTVSTVPKTEQAYAEATPTWLEQLTYVLTRWWWWLIILLLLLLAYWLMKD